MSAVKKAVDKRLLKALVPINALAPQHFNEIADKIIIEDLPAGRVIFKEGERDNRTVYLLAGEITLFSGTAQTGSVYGDTESARHPLSPAQPRQVTAKAKTPVTIARIDTGLLDVLLTWDQSSGYEVTELEDGDEDWMSRMLQSPTFQKLPAANIQKLLMSIEEYPAASGSVVIRQGDPGDYYYIIKQGRCVVTRKASPAAQDVKLAELSVGDSFGEDALISDSKRNATITMLNDGRLMRLAKKDFVALLREPLLAQVSFAKAQSLVGEGAHWLDVRLPGEFQQDHITGAMNIPLSALRHRLDDLDAASRYIVYCDNGGRSSTAAFLLSQHGYDVHVLIGGTQALAPSEMRAVHAQEKSAVRPEASASGTEGAEVIDFSQQAQARKTAEEGATVQKEARHAAEQLLAEARRQSEQLLQEAERQAKQVQAAAAAQLAEARAAQTQIEQAGAKQQSAIQSTLAAERDAAIQKITELEATHNQLAAQHAQLQQALQAEIERAKKLAATPAAADPALAELRRELKAAQRDAQVAEQARQALAQELSATLANLQQLEHAAQDQAAAEQSAALQEELDALRDQWSAAQRDVAQAQQSAQEQLAARDEKIAAMKARLESARQQVLDADHQKTDLEAARDAARVRAEELQSELAQAQGLQIQLDTAEQRVAEQQAARQQLEQDIERLRQAQAQALAEASQAQQLERDALQQQLSELQTQLAASSAAEQRANAMAAELAQLQSQQAQSAEQQQRLDAEHQAALTQLRSTLEANELASGAQLEATRAELAQQTAQLQAQLEQARQAQSAEQGATAAQLAQLREELVAKTQLAEATVVATAELQAQLAEARQRAQAETAQSLATAATLQGELEAAQVAAQTQRAQLEARIKSLQDEADAALTHTNQQADARIAELHAQLAKAEQIAKTEAEQQRSASVALRQELQDAQTAREALQARIKSLQDEADAALSKTSEQADARIAELQAQLAKAEQSAQTETEQLRSASAALQHELQVAQQAREEMQSRIETLQKEADAALSKTSEQADARIAELQAQLVKAEQIAKTEAEQQRSTSAALQHELQTAQKQREELQARIQTLQDEAEAALTRTSKQAGERLAAELAKVRAELEAAESTARSEIVSLRAALQQETLARAQDGTRLAGERTEWQALGKSLEDKLTLTERGRADAEATAKTLEQELERLRGESTTAHRAARDDAARAQQEVEALRAELKQVGEQLNQALGESDAVDVARSQAENEIARLKARVLELESAAQSDDARGGKSEKKHNAALNKLRAELTAAETEAKHRHQELQAQLEQALEQGRATEARFAQQQAQAKESDAKLDQARRRAAQLVEDVEDVKHQLEAQTQQRLAAETARKAAQQEADALRAESQIMSNLGDDHIEASSAQRVREQQMQIARLESELQETKKNVEVAVRLRGESDSARQAFEQEVARLKEHLNSADTVATPGVQRRVSTGGAGVTLRNGLGLGLAAGWLVALGLGAYLALSGGKTTPPTSTPVQVVASVQPAPAVAPAHVAAPKTKPAAVVERHSPAAPKTTVHALGTFRDALRDGGSGPLMTRLPAGSYQMGSAGNSLNFEETPRHDVKLKAFAIGSYEVSFDDYDRYASATGRGQPGDHGWGRGNRPVINISWDDAVAYTRWLSEQTGHHYRLPSEAEWEYAAAAGTSTFYGWGNNGGENHAVCFNCGSRWDGRETAPVGSFAANAFGLYDTAGNVLEWVADCRHDSYQGAPGDGGVWVGGDCARHMARGGAYDSPVDNLRTQSRPYFATGTRLNNLGLRVVRED